MFADFAFNSHRAPCECWSYMTEAALHSAEEEGCGMGARGVEPPITLSFFDHTIGKIVSLRLGADGEPLSPAEQRSQIKRSLVLVKAAEWFFAQQSPGFKRPRQRTLPSPSFIFTEHSPSVQVRLMFGCVGDWPLRLPICT